MRSSQKRLMAAAAGASLIAVLGVAMAQATQVGPDADQSNNELKTGIQNNSNNSYKTWPQALYSDQQQQPQATAPAPAQVSQAPADNPAPPAATDNSSSAQSSTTTTDTSSSTTDNSAAAMPAPKADRN